MRRRDRIGRCRGRSIALSVTCALSLVVISARAVPRVVLTVEDASGRPTIIGESTEPDHRGWIDAIAIGTGFDKLPTADRSHSARRARLVVPNEFVVTKLPDKSSPKFQEALFKAEEFPVVRVKYLSGDPRGASEPILIELGQVRVVEYEIGNSLPDEVPVELVSLSYDEIRWRYRYRDPATGEEGQEESEWDALYATDSKELDSDGDGLVNAVDSDDDGDGAPDDVELAALLNPLVDDLRLDFDLDDDSNMDELLAGTDPNSGHSFFAIDSVGIRNEQGRLAATIRLPATGGRIYKVLGAFSLSDPDGWFVLGEYPVKLGTPSGMVELELPPGTLPLLPELYFRASVERAPDVLGLQEQVP